LVAQTKPQYITPEEFLLRERDAETKSEYFDGVIVAMVDSSPEHNIITANIITELKTRLRQNGCLTFASDLRVRVDACNRYFYPDVSVVCGQPVYQNLERLRSLDNPTLIVEVLSESTERNDRGDKWHCYQTLESLSTYILVAQSQPRIEVYTRMEGDDWRFTRFTGMDGMLPLRSLGRQVMLADIYADVVFPVPESKGH
jgi:Uma2 family endonuclease